MTQTTFTADDGARIPVRIQGEGPPLVILHGWTGHISDWRPLWEELTRHFTCYGWDARPYHADNPVIERMGRDVQNLFDAFGLKRPFLMGHSMGAVTSWEYLRQYGDGRLSALCLIDQSPKLQTDAAWRQGLFGGFSAEDNERFVLSLREGFAHGVVNLIAHSRVGEGEGPGIPLELLEGRRQRLLKLEPEPWIECWQSFVGKDYRDVLPTIRVPTLLVYGDKSNYYGPKVARYVHEHIAGSQLCEYPEAGHGPQLEAMDDFLRDLLAFSRRHGVLKG